MNWMRSAKGRCPGFEPSGVRPDAFLSTFQAVTIQSASMADPSDDIEVPGLGAGV